MIFRFDFDRNTYRSRECSQPASTVNLVLLMKSIYCVRNGKYKEFCNKVLEYFPPQSGIHLSFTYDGPWTRPQDAVLSLQ